MASTGIVWRSMETAIISASQATPKMGVKGKRRISTMSLCLNILGWVEGHIAMFAVSPEIGNMTKYIFPKILLLKYLLAREMQPNKKVA